VAHEPEAPALPRSAATQPGLSPAGPRREPPWFIGVMLRGSTEPRWFAGSKICSDSPRLSTAPHPAIPWVNPGGSPLATPDVNPGGSSGITRHGSVEPRWFAGSEPGPDPPRLAQTDRPADGPSGPSRRSQPTRPLFGANRGGSSVYQGPTGHPGEGSSPGPFPGLNRGGSPGPRAEVRLNRGGSLGRYHPR
jgi:hypothetical protein